MNATQLAQQVGMLSVDEVELIHKCVKALPANPVIVNIGANVGTSAIAMLEVRPDAFIFSLDKRPCPEEQVNLAQFKLEPRRVVRVLGDSSRIGVFWPYSVDLVFVDGAHDDEGVKADIRAWRDKVKPGGFMLFHDYNHPNLPNLSPIVDAAMAGCKVVGKARFLIGFEV